MNAVRHKKWPLHRNKTWTTLHSLNGLFFGHPQKGKRYAANLRGLSIKF